MTHEAGQPFLDVLGTGEGYSGDLEGTGYAAQGPGVVRQVVLYFKENAVLNNTQPYKTMQGQFSALVLRRANIFKVGLHVDPAVRQSMGQCQLIMSLGNEPNEEDGSMARLVVPAAVGTGMLPGQWSLSLQSESMGMLMLNVQVPANAPVGRWTMTMAVGGEVVFTVRIPIYILFNPWSPEEPVYIADDVARNFYTMQDKAVIFHGVEDMILTKTWYYGQFDKVTLPAIEFLMNIKKMTPAERSDPITVVRAMSAAVNTNDDNGLVVGLWKGPFSDGIHPFAWSSSPTVLHKYMESGGNGVKYGQCFVFAGLLTALLRALGVPARAITNYSSAHKDPNHDNIKFFFNDQGQVYHMIGSVWNYHVWTECWLNRTDLLGNFSGWQIVDGTPQAPSVDSGNFEVGPFPTTCVLLDRLDVPYDGVYARAAVKATWEMYSQDPSQPEGVRLVKVVRNNSGRLLVTEEISEMPGHGNPEDITATYKQPQATARQLTEQPIEIALKHNTAVEIGEPVVIVCTATNNDVQPHQANITLTATSVMYNSWSPTVVGSKTASVTVAPGSEESFQLVIPPEMYIGKLHVEGMIEVQAGASLSQGLAVARGVLFIKMPALSVNILANSRAPGEVHFQLQMTNPLNTPLTQCELILELPLSTRLLEKIPLEDVPVGGLFERSGTLIADSPDTKELIATFMSAELPHVQGIGAI